MRKLSRSPKKEPNLPLDKKVKADFAGVQAKISFRCDIFLLERIKNTLASQHLAGSYRYPNLSYFFRTALHAYQRDGMALSYQRELNHPRKEVSFRLTEDLRSFYQSLPLRTRAEICERVLGSFYYGYLG